jgi:hypothetical protein
LFRFQLLPFDPNGVTMDPNFEVANTDFVASCPDLTANDLLRWRYRHCDKRSGDAIPGQ